MKPYVDALKRHGVEAVALELPRHGRTPVKAELAVPTFLAAAGDWSPVIIGGHSYGGRVASLAALQRKFAGLILLSYPLHRPGHPEELKTDHWPRIECPVLLLSGEKDPFARIDLLRKSVKLLRQAELVTFPGLRHGLTSVADAAMERAAQFIRENSGTSAAGRRLK
jgi:predicted alpha/beta-hydrolase family hydrolase